MSAILTDYTQTGRIVHFPVGFFSKKIPGWAQFLSEIDRSGIYSFIKGEKIPETGYLYLLESVLGKADFRQICPLALNVQKEFLPASEKILQRAETLPLSESLETLMNAFGEMQIKKVRSLMPIGIDMTIKTLLKAIVSESICTSTILWPYYNDYLELRYGLKNGAPKEWKKTAAVKLTRHFERTNGCGFVSKSMICHWILAIENSLHSELALKFFKATAKIFTIEKKLYWPVVLQDALKLLGGAEENHSNSYILEMTIAELLDSKKHNDERIIGTLDYHGIQNVKNLIQIDEASLYQLKQIGKFTVERLVESLRKFCLKLGMTEEEIFEWEKSMQNPKKD